MSDSAGRWRLAAVFLAAPLLRGALLLLQPVLSGLTGVSGWPLGPPGAIAPATLLLLDLAALVAVAAAILGGRVLGTGFGTITLAAVVVILPVAGLGALAEWLAGREVSDLMGLLCLLAMGVGFSVAVPARRERFEQGLVSALAVGLLLVGAKVAAESQPWPGVLFLVAPYLGAASLSAALRPLGRLGA